MNKRIFVSTTLLTVLLGACSSQPTTEKARLEPIAQWTHAAGGDQHTVSMQDWWQGFADPVLDALITEALSANQDVRMALARVQEAQAQVTISESHLYPNLDMTASGGQERSMSRVFGVPGADGMKLLMPTGNAVSGGMAASWEIDLFGGRHHEAEALAAQSAGINAELHNVKLALVAQLMSHYHELRGLQQRIAVQQQLLDLHQQRLNTLQQFYQQGLVNATATTRQQTRVHGSKATLALLKQLAEIRIHRLGVLCGQSPDSLESRLQAENQAGISSNAYPALPEALPSELLEQRPDLKIAKAQVLAADESVGAANANRLPRLVLSVSGGYGLLSAGGFPTLTDSIYTLGSGLSAPIFSAGRIEAQISAADARLQQAAAQYEKTFLQAMEDVENAYVSYHTSQERLAQLSAAQDAAAQAQTQSLQLYRQGAGDYLTTLDADADKLALVDASIQAQTDVKVAVVALYRAFGGGWE
jgi:NodT family efflux transporter outer membrane factor (OMF) lipoprotein